MARTRFKIHVLLFVCAVVAIFSPQVRVSAFGKTSQVTPFLGHTFQWPGLWPSPSPRQGGQLPSRGPIYAAPPQGPPPPPPNPQRIYTVGIMMFPGVEVLDFAGPFEVFAVGGNVHGRFRALTVSDKPTVSALNGLRITVDHVFGTPGFPRLDVVVVPGSAVNQTLAALDNPVYTTWLRSIAREPEVEYILSVCTGVNFLCRAGLANGLTLTTHHQAFDLAERECREAIQSGGASLVRRRRFTDNGDARVLTSAGISAGIDLSLYFTKKLLGRDAALGVAERMEYDWKDYAYEPEVGPIPSPTRPPWHSQK